MKHRIPSNPNFHHTLAEDDSGGAGIKSMCKLCGAFQIVSLADGSPEDWEAFHECSQKSKVDD